MKSLDQVISFVVAARHRSFAGAARELGLSPSAVAKNVARFEGGLGVRLFHRTTRQVTLTADGETLFERCARILAEVEALEVTAEGRQAEPRGVLRIDLPRAYGRRVVVPVIAQLTERYVQLEVDARFSDRHVDLINDGLDAAVRIGGLADSGLVARPIDEQILILFASPAYLARAGTPRTPADLGDHRCIRYRLPTSGRLRPWEFRSGRRTLQLDIASPMQLNDGDALVHAALAGAGIVQAPSYMVEEALANGELVELLAEYRRPPMPISVVYPSQRQVPLRVRALIDALVAARDNRGG